VKPILSEKLKIAVGIATTGRREVLTRTIDLLARQNPSSRQFGDMPCPPRMWTSRRWSVFRSNAHRGRSKGLPAQRNMILSLPARPISSCSSTYDFFADRDYLANVERIFTASADIVAQPGFCWRMEPMDRAEHRSRNGDDRGTNPMRCE